MRACPQICHVCVSDKKNPEKIHGRDRDGRVVCEGSPKLHASLSFYDAFSDTSVVSLTLIDTSIVSSPEGSLFMTCKLMRMMS